MNSARNSKIKINWQLKIHLWGITCTLLNQKEIPISKAFNVLNSLVPSQK